MSILANDTAAAIPYIASPLGLQSGTPGQFDLYVLAQSWQPYFCSTGNNWPGCEDPTDYMSTQLTIHGLWPNYSDDGYPSFCNGPDLTDNDIKKAGASDVAKYWPDVKTGGTTFVSNEWDKHGTCSGLSPSEYVRKTIDMHIKIGTKSIISNNVDDSVSSNSIRSAYGASKVSLICRDGALSEVRTCYDKAFRQISCPRSVLNQDNCGKNGQSIEIYSF